MSRRPYRLFLILPVLLVLYASNSWGQRSQIRFQHLSLREGLSQSTVYCVLQSRDGFMWFGTQDGLNRFDGYRFKAYKHIPGRPDSLSDNTIRSLYEDERGILWVGTDGGLNRFDPGLERFDHYRHDPDRQNSPGHDRITAILPAGRDRLWLGTQNGLCLVDTRNNEIRRIDLSKARSLEGNLYISAIHLDEQARVWLGTYTHGLIFFDPKSGDVRQLLAGTEPGPTSAQIIAVCGDRQGRLWLGTETGGLFRMTWQDGQAHFKPFEAFQSFGTATIQSLYQDHQGMVWVCTDNGLSRINPETEEIDHYRHNPSEPTSLGHNVVMCAYQDRQQHLWLGTYGGGISHTDFPRKRMVHYRASERPFQLPNNQVMSIYEDHRERIWIGTYGGGISLFQPETERFTTYTSDGTPHSLSDNRVYSILEDEQHRLWVATYNGLNRLDHVNRHKADQAPHFIHYRYDPNDPHSLRSNQIRELYEDRLKRLWIGSHGGLHRLDPDAPGFISYHETNAHRHGLSDNRVWVVYQDRSGRIWVGTYHGLNILDVEKSRFTRFFHNERNPDTISDNRIWSIFHDSRYRLWVGTAGGLNRYIPGENRFEAFRKADGLPNDTIYGILEDERGDLWLATNHGLSRFSPVNGQFKNFDFEDGLQSDEFNPGAAVQRRNGEMLFGGIGGFNLFHPEQLQPDGHIPPVVLTELLLANEPVVLSSTDPDSPLERILGQTEHLTLSYTDYLVSFEFAALHHASPGKNRYAYRLEGLDRDWIYTDANNRRATYTRLAPRNYTFRVKASNAEGVWNEEGTFLRITVNPPPWRTWWAYTLYMVLLVILLSLIFNRQARKLEGERLLARKEREISHQLRHLDRLKDEFLANTSHELRTPLNGIIGIAESLMAGATGELPEKTRNNLSMIVTGGRRLASLVNDLLDFSKLKNRSLDLQLRPLDLHALVEVVVRLSQPLVGNKDVQLINAVAQALPPAHADENRLQQILHNLIGNAVKFTHSGSVRVTARIVEHHLEVCVADTGIGIAAKDQQRIFVSFEQADGAISRSYSGTGLGLAITRQLIELHHGRIWVESAPGEGASFFFTLPLAKADEVSQPMTQPLVSAIRYEDLTDSGYTLPATTEPDQNAPHLLIVDDEPINRQVLINHLSLENYRISVAEDGREALAQSEMFSFDLILLDIMMPGLSGYEVCEHLRRRFSVQDLPVIFMTARNQVDDLVTAFRAGANDFITKPVARAELLSRVHTHLRLLEYNRHLESKVSERTRELAVKNEELETVDGIVRLINREITIEGLFSALLDQVCLLFPQADKGSFLLWNCDNKRFEFISTSHDLKHSPRLGMTQEQVYLRTQGSADQADTFVFLTTECRLLPGQEDSLPLPKSMLAMKMVVSDELQAILMLDNDTQTGAFTREDAEKLDRFRGHAVTALSKAGFLRALEEKHEQLMSGVRYGRRIQDALLPHQRELAPYFDHFVLHLPKGIVSGDFYWFHARVGQIFLAVVDCTGHGVPGAFLSMIGHTLLNKIIIEDGMGDPARILETLDVGVHDAFHQETGTSDTRDGMDLTLCRWIPDRGELVVAGARQTFYLARADGTLRVIKGERRGIGGSGKEKNRPFTNQTIRTEKGDSFYLTTDGYIDQSNPDNRRFGTAGFRRLLMEIQDKTMPERRAMMLQALIDHQRTEEQRDDITVIGIQLSGDREGDT